MLTMSTHHAELKRVTKPENYTQVPVAEGVHQVVLRIPQFGIGDVRRLISSAHRTPEGDATLQQIVVVTKYITVEAQQALLKVVEEPPVTTSFLFVIPHSLQLLPTLLSRLSPIDQVDSEGTCNIDAFMAFLEAGIKERLEQIELATKQKDTEWISDIRCGLTDHLKQKVGLYTENKLRSLSFVVTTLETRGAANKMLLEELALTL